MTGDELKELIALLPAGLVTAQEFEAYVTKECMSFSDCKGVAPAIAKRIIEARPGGLSTQNGKGFTPTVKAPSSKPANPALAPVVEAVEVATDESVDDEEAALLAAIAAAEKANKLKALKQKLVELNAANQMADSQLVDAEAQLVETQKTLAEKQAAHDLRLNAEKELLDLAIATGTQVGQNAIDRQKAALKASLETAKKTPTTGEVALARMAHRQSVMQNELQAVLNAVPALLPAMGTTTTGAVEQVTVDV
ncbi:MAG: hypothetical protein ACRC1W_06345 [Shewanella sp.]